MILKTFITFLIICHVSESKQNISCHQQLKELGDAQSKFVYCVTVNSSPVTMCTNCKEKYDPMQETYDTLVKNCSDTYFDKDRINMVASTNLAFTDLWSKAYCPDCFNNNNSFVFDEKNTTFTDCLGLNVDNPCDKCMSEYMDLNKFYINLDQYNNGEVCYDLQDSMNRTRNLWSKELKCCQREFNMTLFTVVLSLISCLPLLFYGSTYFFTKYQERNHGILNDEDPLFHSTSAPSTSVPSTLNVNPSSSGSSSGNNPNNPARKPEPKVNLPPKLKGFNILDEEPKDVSSADKKQADTKKVFNIYNQNSDDESSDDENMAINVMNNSKEKLK